MMQQISQVDEIFPTEVVERVVRMVYEQYRCRVYRHCRAGRKVRFVFLRDPFQWRGRRGGRGNTRGRPVSGLITVMWQCGTRDT